MHAQSNITHTHAQLLQLLKCANAQWAQKHTQVFIKSKVYFCGDKFQTELIEKLMESHESYGFAIIDGNGCLMGKL